MEIIPSIDIRGGKVVRLYQGDYGKETVYGDDPLEVAVRWQEAGAPRIHVVDLDGAKAGKPMNLEVLRTVVSGVSIPVQVGGGVRSMETAQTLLDAGVQRVIFGTAAVRDPELIRSACEKLGADAAIVGVDARNGMVAVRGWSETTSMTAEDLVKSMAYVGVRRFIATDIAVDGTLNGPNVEIARSLAGIEGVSIISSGGVGSLADVERLAHTGVEGVILGSALYRGAIELREAIAQFGA